MTNLMWIILKFLAIVFVTAGVGAAALIAYWAYEALTHDLDQ
jgi:hypothetical protein